MSTFKITDPRRIHTIDEYSQAKKQTLIAWEEFSLKHKGTQIWANYRVYAIQMKSPPPTKKWQRAMNAPAGYYRPVKSNKATYKQFMALPLMPSEIALTANLGWQNLGENYKIISPADSSTTYTVSCKVQPPGTEPC
ncbi:MAG: hypothetical protein ACPGXY_03145 [Alphaproteobacteria bacterium]